MDHSGKWQDAEMVVAISAARDYLELPFNSALKSAHGLISNGLCEVVKNRLEAAGFTRNKSQIYTFFRDRIVSDNAVKSKKVDALLWRLFQDGKKESAKAMQLPLDLDSVAKAKAKPAKPAEQLLTEQPVESLKTIVNAINEVFGNVAPKFDFKGSIKPVEQNTSNEGIPTQESCIKDAQHNLLECAVLLHELVIQFMKVAKEKVARLKEENKQLRTVNMRLDLERSDAIRKLNRIKSQVNETVQ